MIRRRTLLAGAISIHLSVLSLHGLVHVLLPVHVHAWQYGSAVVTGLVGPIIGAALHVRRKTTLGLSVIALSGVAALTFEALYHFVIVNPDHVTTVTNGRALFATTAALSTAGDGVLIVCSLWILIGTNQMR